MGKECGTYFLPKSPTEGLPSAAYQEGGMAAASKTGLAEQEIRTEYIDKAVATRPPRKSLPRRSLRRSSLDRDPSFEPAAFVPR